MVNKLLLLLALLLVTLGAPALAQPAPDSPAQAPPAFNVEAATRHYLDTLTPAQKAQSDAYFEGGYWLQLWEVVYALAVAGVFLGLGLGRRLRALVERLPRRWLRTWAYAVLYLLASFVLTLPLTVYEGYVREHSYGLSNLTFGAWAGETLTSLALTVVFGSLTIVGLYAAIRRGGATWWVGATAIASVFLVIGVAVGPVFISPLFNKYTALPAGPVRDGILSMARANGVPADNVYYFDASKQSKRISANVSGLGSTIRVSLNDNLLKRCTPAEVQAVMGHELGHYVLNHIVKMLVFFVILLAIGFWLVDRVASRLLARYGPRWGIAGLADVASLPLLVALFSVAGLLATPLTNTIVRTSEQEADMFGLNAARQPDGFAAIAMKLSEYRKIEPSPLEEIIFFDHPSGRTRVQSAMRWKAEHLADH
ncbi:M48 family metallopeptidase [Hymenobacter cheonanensis]|uniref:M48 family metallopeptidase n=1 Tax=Hymenobacter sp. CA2-7 TaxID=3063993 RepID=UPI002712ED0B|nr:M48 family metallopeptidase [Hymenobacter sp. CA2-7]MDO7885527.1 M48 family metallopeptidase [Hymenobacter sp. CA2-7]